MDIFFSFLSFIISQSGFLGRCLSDKNKKKSAEITVNKMWKRIARKNEKKIITELKGHLQKQSTKHLKVSLKNRIGTYLSKRRRLSGTEKTGRRSRAYQPANVKELHSPIHAVRNLPSPTPSSLSVILRDYRNNRCNGAVCKSMGGAASPRSVSLAVSVRVRRRSQL